MVCISEHFSDRNNNVLGDWTEIIVEKKDVGKLNAIINSVEGESLND